VGLIYRTLHDVETRYASYDRKLLAIHDCLMHWEPYCINRHMTVYTDQASLPHILSQQKLSCRHWRHMDNQQQIDCSIKYFPGAANVVADALSSIQHPVSGTPAATIGINTMEVQIIGTKEWKQEVCELLVEDASFGPIVNIRRVEADVTKGVQNQESQCSKYMHHRE
jgi:hypothetical protein